MPKVKMPRKSTNVDMTAMCDVAFLLLTFFMLATKFKPDEPVVVKTPSSISEIPIPDVNIMLITVDPKGRIFFSIDNKNMRRNLIESVDEYKKLGLNDVEKTKFSIGASIGVPFSQLKSYLDLDPESQGAYDAKAPGVPSDTTVLSEQNELAAWIRMARNTNPQVRIVIKADADASYPAVRTVIRTLEGWKIYKFNLLTSLKSVPVGSAAYKLQQSGKSK